jgi:hypothetical protein
MGQIYRQGYDEDGGIINPEFFVDSMGDLAGAFNSGLDRDNFAQADITYDDVGVGVIFVNIDREKTDTAFTPDTEITEWQGGTGNDADGIVNIAVNAVQDGHYDIHFSVSWSWDGTYSWVTDGARPDRTDTFDTIMFRMVCDGIPIAYAGPFEDGGKQWSTYLCGAIQLPAGRHTFVVECKCVRRIAQNGQEDGVCTNTPTIESRAYVSIGRYR